MKKIIGIILTGLLCFVFCANAQKAEKPFVHPGMAQSRQDLDYMKKKVLAGEQPYKDAFERLKNNTPLSFKPQPFTHVSVGAYGANSKGGSELSQSADMAYNSALLWYITGDKTYADKAIEILNAWSPKLWDFDENNAKLNVGLTSYYFLNAAEILKNTNSGWKSKDIEQFKRFITGPYYSTIKDFFTEANGNWDGSMINSMLCMGVFLDNHEMFNRALERFYHGPNNSGITKYVYPSGQIQETTRDWGHVQLGIGEFEKAAQIAWTQGVNLYGAAGNRLALAYEYTAKYMLGEDVPVYGVISPRERGKFRDIYEAIYQHYHARGIEMPYTLRVINEKTRSKSTSAFLTSVHAPLAITPKTQTILKAPASVLLNAGALTSPTAQSTTGAILVSQADSIQPALNASAGTGKWVVLGKGVFQLRGPLRIPSGVTLAGQGRETILMLSPKINGKTVVNTDKDMHDVMLRDFILEGAVSAAVESDPNSGRRTRSYMSAPARAGIEFQADEDNQMHNIRFEHLTVQNCTKNGVSVRGGAGIMVKDCSFNDNGANVVPGGGLMHNLHLTHSSNIDISGSRFDTSPFGSGIDISYSHEVTITNNEAARNKLSGIRCTESNNVKVSNNLTEGNDEHGIKFDTLLDSFHQINLSNNIIQYNTLSGIYLEKVPDGVVSNNTLIGNGK
ncbi:MAG TPA: right-handed parallel beta-helix repeat-containing protein [Mucilaginibacter sp.]|jgi:parallel beta-helix repeat protein|nr:right-handed parallel beta-helix repeat-containing protein [Mucilaginibacter sp.]